MEKSKKILKVENLKKAYYSTSRTGESITYPVLNNVSFEIEEGEFVGIMGRSGCGKTTLLKAVGMLDKPDDGTIYYKNYKEEWLREVQLYNKVMAAYRCKPGGKVRLYYKMKQKDREELGYRAEAMMPVYENLYVKQFVLYNDESVNYYFQESGNGEMITTDKKTLKTDKERVFAGKYQMLNAMTDMDSDAERSKAMLEFEEEEQMADQIFKIY